MKPTVNVAVVTIESGQRLDRTDLVAVEEPLEIRVDGQSIAVTMRTPGHDFELAAGFLLTEGVVRGRADIREIGHCPNSSSNVVKVDLNPAVNFDPNKLSRHVFTSSSCGVCGKTTLEQVQAALPAAVQPRLVMPAADVLCGLPEKLRTNQTVFSSTGGLHATALFDGSGELLLLREDVGRHNAMDKLIGALLLEDKLPAADTIVLVSGRASFELVQKAAMAGIPALVAVGAPSSLAVELARQLGMTLVGFLRGQRFNIYCRGTM